MSRRDTIITAVLVNAALLAILFMMAIHSDDESDSPDSVVTVENNEESNPVFVASPEPQKVETNMVWKEVIPNAPIPVTLAADNIMTLGTAPAQTSTQETIEPIPISSEPSQVSSQPVVTQPDTDQFVNVTIKKGDSLDKIARMYGSSVDAIKTANQLKNEKLKIGQVLKVPKIKSAASSPSKPPVVVSDEAQYYTMKAGDSPWKIAKQFKMDLADLLKLNGLNDDTARNLKVGDKIRVR